MNIKSQNIIPTFKIVCKEIKKMYSNDSQSFIGIILGFILVFTIRLLLLSLDSLFIDDGYTIQYLIFMISTWLLITGIEVGYSKLIFNKIDLIPTNIKNIFNHFSLLPTYIGGIIINVCILILSIIPGILYIYMKYGFQIFDIVTDSFSDPYYKELINSYFNTNDLLIISILLIVPILLIQLRCCFWNLYVIDKNCSPINAFKKSWSITQNQELKIFVYFILFIILNGLGVLGGIIGLCFTLPISYLFIFIYYRLLNE